MMTHELKTWPEYFQGVWEAAKNFEVRPCHDRDFSVGDLLHLREFDPCLRCNARGGFALKQDGLFGGKSVVCESCNGAKGSYTGREITAIVSYVMLGGQLGVAKNHVVMSLVVKQRASASARLSEAQDG